MQLNLFGGFGLVDRDGGVLRMPQKRGQALLAYLALKEGHGESREVIVDLLWPDRFKKQAQASLRQILFELRKLTAADPIVVATRGEVSLGTAIRGCDVWIFNECAASDDLDDAGHALKLQHSPFLDGPPLGSEPFQQWAAIQRARLEGKLDRVVLAATVAWEEQDSHETALALLEDLLRLSPMCVRAMLRIMEIEAANGNVAEAVRKYQRYARRLKIEFDDAPPVELHDAYEVLKSTPVKHSKFSLPKRRPAHAQADPWRKTSIDAPVVAVLPFRHLGNGECGDAMAAAIGEDITMMLSGCRWFSVLSRSATHSFASGAPFIPKDFVNRTDADYLVYGAVVERRPNWSVTIELADAESGLITWAKRYDTAEDGLGPVDIHFSARRQPARCIIAAKLVSVFSYLVAMRRNCLRSQKKFSTRWRHLYIAKSHGIERTRSALGGMTAMAPRLSSSARIQSMSKALSASRASKSIPSINGATPMLSWRWPGSSRKRVRLPSASTSATIFVVSPPRDRPMA